MAIQGTALPTSQVVTTLLTSPYDMDTYGKSMSGAQLDKLINNKMPIEYDCTDCRDFNMARLRYVGPLREYNLDKGKYTGFENGVLVTQPLNKTFDKVMKYVREAIGKADRARRLNNSMPSSHNPRQAQNNIHLNNIINTLSQVS